MYYRIHDTSRCAPEDLLRPENQYSQVWVGVMYRRCADCEGSGLVTLHEECATCRGEGQEMVERQRGVSVCRSLDALRDYMEDRNPRIDDDCVIVELDGIEADDTDIDAEHGAVLVIPIQIVRVLPMSKM